VWIFKSLACVLRGHRRIQAIDRLSGIESDGFGGIRARVELYHFECWRCGAELD